MWSLRYNQVLLLGYFAFLGGCFEGSGTTDDPLSIDRIEISPRDTQVNASEDTEPIQFSATVYWNSGDIMDSAPVAWGSSNQIAGEMDVDGLFTPSASNGGITLITASYLGANASTTLTVVYRQDVVEDGLPADLPEMVDEASFKDDSTRAPTLIYPYDGVIVPRNIAQLDVQWHPADDRPLTVLELDSITTFTRVFTLSDRWVPGESQWQAIAATNSGGSVTISAYSGVLEGEGEDAVLVGDLIGGGRAVEMSISRLDATGAIYYWSSSNHGIMRIASDSDRAATFFTPDPEVQGSDCVSCHSLSPTGRRMGVGYQAEGGNRQGLLELHGDDPPTELLTFDTAIVATYTTTTPDERYTIGVDGGALSLYDGETWDYFGPADVGFETVANPKFSPDGLELVFSAVDPDNFNGDMHFFEGRIAAAPFDPDTALFGAPHWITPRVEGANQYYPVYSPDGNWIAYNQSYSDTPGSPAADSMMDENATLYLVDRNGAGAPIRLDNLNDIDQSLFGPSEPPETPPDGEIPPEDETPTPGDDPPPDNGSLIPVLGNSWPGWGPLPDADLLWLTFSSLRGFGHDVSYGNPQIWVSAIDPEKAEAGIDPSSPPFWLPLQDPFTNNHIPQWGTQ